MSPTSPRSLKRWRPLEWLAAAAVVLAIGATTADTVIERQSAALAPAASSAAG